MYNVYINIYIIYIPPGPLCSLQFIVQQGKSQKVLPCLLLEKFMRLVAVRIHEQWKWKSRPGRELFPRRFPLSPHFTVQ